MEYKINTVNAATYYKIANIFALSNLSKFSLCFIERRFTTVANSQNFLKLDSTSVAKILSRNELHIDSELQVYEAADAWLSYNLNKCSKISNYILMKTRLPLLSDDAIKFLLRNSSTFYKNEEFAATIQEFLQNKNFFLEFKSKHIYQSRYCNQNNFNIIVCGGRAATTISTLRDVYSIEANNVGNVNVLPQMKEGRGISGAVSIKDNVYVFGGYNNFYKSVMSVEKYSLKTNTWETITEMCDDRKHFCACSFMDNVYIIGGWEINSCFEFNTKDRTWKEVASMNEIRGAASRAVFEGRILVSGGSSLNGVLNTVEAYDHIADSWSFMPNMIERRRCHKSVGIKNKLFVIGGCGITSSEVFDSLNNKFVLLKSPQKAFKKYFNSPAEVVSIGIKLVLFCDRLGMYSNSILFYDVDSDEWSEETWKAEKILTEFSCVKVPQ